ncbi:hypothetical protein ARMA_2556 [Ardenticatena maritima]|uniref:Uncharacterized protein n=1 Tax=Ardenticatena maritima TaxID=872965 RepID=A0A0M8K8R9_9CHLR|nr:hypothetical protein ARMA_2556 [Ardenticatena maritima]
MVGKQELVFIVKYSKNETKFQPLFCAIFGKSFDLFIQKLQGQKSFFGRYAVFRR